MSTSQNTCEMDEADYEVSYRNAETSGNTRVGGSSKQNQWARYRRGRSGRGESFNGSHRRRNKRNYL